jgi:hypothetical protein
MMICSSAKKNYPIGTFIPTPARICAIIQLCLACMIILWNGSYPFMGELFAIKSRQLIYQEVMGAAPSGSIAPERIERLQRNAEKFQNLPESEKKSITKGLSSIEKLLQRSFSDKLAHSLHILILELPAFEKMWLLLSLVIPVLLLKKVEGASLAVWLLPLLTLFYVADNLWHAPAKTPSPDSLLFPTEEIILTQHLKEPLKPHISEQQAQLQRGWKLYIVAEWAKQKPSSNLQVFEAQVEEGEFAFNLERIKRQPIPSLNLTHYKEPFALMVLYLAWNMLFAFIAWKYTCRLDTQQKFI